MDEKSRGRLLLGVAGVFFVLSWGISLRVPPWPDFYNELSALVSLLALAAWLISRSASLSFSSGVLFVFAASFIPLVQYMGGVIQFFGDMVMSSAYIALFGLSILIGVNLRDQVEEAARKIAYLLLCAALLSFFLALHQWLNLTHLGVWLIDVPPNGRPHSNIGQPNNLATLFCLGLAALVYLRARVRLSLSVYFFLGLSFACGIAMTRSRTALLILLVLFVWFVFWRSRIGLKVRLVELLSVLAVSVVLWWVWPALSDVLLLSADSAMGRAHESLGGDLRLEVWRQMLYALWAQPLGYGWGQLGYAQLAVIHDMPGVNAPFAYAHNIVLDLLVWNGLVLGGVLLIVISVWMIRALLGLKSHEHWFLYLVVLLIGTHSLLEFPHAYLYFLLTLGVCAGLVAQPGRIALNLSRKTASVFLLMSVLVTAWVTIEFHVVEADYRQMRYESIGIAPKSPRGTAPEVVLLTQQREFIRFARTEARENMEQSELRWMQRIAHRYPYSPSLLRYALALGLNHQPELAALELKKLIRLQPDGRYEETREVWSSLQEQFSQLADIPFPTP